MGPHPEANVQGQAQFVQPQYTAVVQAVPMQRGEWHVGLFDCFQDCGLCCDVCWCSCCAAGRMYDAMDNRPDSMNVPVCLAMMVGEYFIGGIAQCLFSLYVRDKARNRYGIVGDGCGDCCASFWCAPCVMCQTHRELSHQGTPPGYTCCEPTIKYTTQAPVVGQPAAQPAYAMPQQQPVTYAPPVAYGQQPQQAPVTAQPVQYGQ